MMRARSPRGTIVLIGSLLLFLGPILVGGCRENAPTIDLSGTFCARFGGNSVMVWKQRIDTTFPSSTFTGPIFLDLSWFGATNLQRVFTTVFGTINSSNELAFSVLFEAAEGTEETCDIVLQGVDDDNSGKVDYLRVEEFTCVPEDMDATGLGLQSGCEGG